MPERSMNCAVRPATPADVPALEALIAASVRGLMTHDYDAAQIDASLRTVFTVDTQLIDDGTYFIAEIDGVMAGCAGWSRRKTLCGGSHHTTRDNALLDPARDAAKIRAIFVHPHYARQGLGSLLLQAAEDAAAAAGFTRLEMGATLTGVPLYRLRGYTEVEHMQVSLGDGIALPVVRMEKFVAAL